MGAVGPTPRRVGVIVGLPQEAAILKRALGSAAPPIFCSGAKTSRVADGVAVLLANGADILVSFGFAGGLAPEWSPGDVIVAGMITGPDGTDYWPDLMLSLLMSAALGRCGLNSRPATVLGVDRVIASVEDKRRLAEAHVAAAVDMESCAMAKAASGRPFVVVRVIVDPASRAIPSSVLASIDDDGRVRPLALIGGLLRHPSDVFSLAALAQDSRAARRSLRRAAAAVGRAFGLV